MASQNPTVKAGQGNLLEGKEPQEQAKTSETHPLPLLRIPEKHQVKNHNIFTMEFFKSPFLLTLS